MTTNPQTDEIRQPAYDAVYAYIRSSDRVPGDIVTRNAMIWRAVHAALDAVAAPVPAPAPAVRPECDCVAEVHMGVGFYHQPQCATRNSQPADVLVTAHPQTAVSVPASAPTDRAAIEAAAYRAAANYVRGNSADERYGKASISTAMCTVADELYRWAAAAASGSGRVADETQAEPALRCVCGDPVQLMDDNDPTSWIHSPGSDTRCLDARPRCPECQMPHDLTPSMKLTCASIRASITDHEAQQPETQADDVMFGSEGCTCMPWTVEDGQPRYLEPHETVDKVSGWARRPDCPHHQPAVVSQPDGDACTCADAGPAFAPAGHYADCPQATPDRTPS